MRSSALSTLVIIFFSSLICFGQEKSSDWPREIESDNYLIKIYAPEDLTYHDHELKSKADMICLVDNCWFS